jgi:hypothetical protein
MTECWRRPFSVAMIKIALSGLVLPKMFSNCGWNLQIREI